MSHPDHAHRSVPGLPGKEPRLEKCEDPASRNLALQDVSRLTFIASSVSQMTPVVAFVESSAVLSPCFKFLLFSVPAEPHLFGTSRAPRLRV